LWRGQPLELMIVTAITLVVAAVPESLLAVVTLSLVAGRAAPDLTELLRASVLCNDGSLQAPDDTGHDWLPVGDPTEVALTAAAAKFGIDRRALRAELPRVAERPFDSIRKRMSTTHQLPDGQEQPQRGGVEDPVSGRPQHR
jgi:magnesium-transporting ATPase (P-type)